MKNQIETGNLKHAYLFCGPAGCGKTSSARIIANTINENNSGLVELDCASHNGVNDVRAIIEDCKFRPLNSRYKIWLLDEIQMLSVEGFNAMLKILEEPPEYVIFLLCTTDPQKILPTIMSRVQRFNFSRISNEDIENRLRFIIDSENKEKASSSDTISYDERALNYIARLARGGMRDSITTLEKCLDYDKSLTLENVIKVTSGGITEDVMCQFLSYMLNKDGKSALVAFNSIYMSGIDVVLFVKVLTEFVQNIIKYLMVKSSDITTLSPVSVAWVDPLDAKLKDFKDLLHGLLYIKTDFNPEDMKIVVESWIIEKCN